MFRENVLVKEDIIDRVSKTMIPVALDYEKVLSRRTRESRFVRPLIKQSGDNQGVWIFSPEGKVLGRWVGFGDMHGKTKRVIENALASYGPVENRSAPKGDADPSRGIGFRPDGSVRLAEYVRRRDRDRIRGPVISSVILSAKELGEFAPPSAAVGEKWTLPETVAKKLCRAASPMCYQHAPQPSWVKSVLLKAEVRSARSGSLVLRYEGRLASERIMRDGKVLSEQKLELEGEGVYDTSVGRMSSLVIVGTGVFRWPEEAPDRPVPFDSLVEWRSGR